MNPTTTIHPRHKTWVCQENVDGTECNTYNDVNDLICRRCDYEIDGWTKVKAADVNEMYIGELHSYEDGVAKWCYYDWALNRGPTVEDVPGNNAAANRGTTNGTNGTNGNGGATNGATTNGNHGRH
ncbi:hypothetical protein FGADI_9101 [Fusarium gaditjirri]|uniref:Uncharacterized protein n=1 Tax=Fusarium gaditjirri TaxID=282569 RepID=A0A8H4T0W5_9HYPO|nr:hypothetical protein FGADI_9101 [Fusarium gaditjirri]